MKKILALITLILFLAFGIGAANAQSILPPCENEDGSITLADGTYGYQDCYWDAQTRGNGLGQSFMIVGGVVTYTGESVAEVAQVPVADVADQAWALFDATGAASLLPPEGTTRVSFVGYNNTGFTPTANQITVWDEQGNYYLFEF